jgi:hypothetical protein
MAYPTSVTRIIAQRTTDILKGMRILICAGGNGRERQDEGENQAERGEFEV